MGQLQTLSFHDQKQVVHLKVLFEPSIFTAITIDPIPDPRDLKTMSLVKVREQSLKKNTDCNPNQVIFPPILETMSPTLKENKEFQPSWVGK